MTPDQSSSPTVISCLDPVFSIASEETTYNEHLDDAHGHNNPYLQEGPPGHPTVAAFDSVSVTRLPSLEIVLVGDHFVQLLTDTVKFGLRGDKITEVQNI